MGRDQWCLQQGGRYQPYRVSRSESPHSVGFIHSPEYPIAEIVRVANIATLKDKKNLPDLTEYLRSDNRIIRYWAATGLLILGKDAESSTNHLTATLRDPSPDVAIVAAEVLYRPGQCQKSMETLLAALENPNVAVRTFALNVIDNLDERSSQIRQAVERLGEKSKDDKSPERFDLRMVNWLTAKWNSDVNRISN
jgi:HEAT repeat protein